MRTKDITTRLLLWLALVALCSGMSATASLASKTDPSTGTFADQPFLATSGEFLERSYVAFLELPPPKPDPTSFGPEGPRPKSRYWLIMEAQPAIHFLFHDELHKNIRRGRECWSFIPSFTLQLPVRFLNTTSSPVRTPSFMPRVNLQWINVQFPRKIAKSNDAPALREIEVALRIGHHSNGQEYCSFSAGHLDSGCPPIDTTHPNLSTANLVNGGFGTNYVALVSHIKHVRRADSSGFAKQTSTWGFAYEYNPKMGAGGLDDVHGNLYGQLRLRVDWEWTVLTNRLLCARRAGWSGQARAAASLEWIMINRGPGISQYRLTVELARTFAREGGTGGFIRFFSGQDYYNINYVNKIDGMIQVGIVLDPSSLFHLGEKFDYTPE